MRTKDEIVEYIKTYTIAPNSMPFLLSRFEYEDAKQFLKEGVDKETFYREIYKSEDDHEAFLNTIKNSFSSLFINLCNDLIVNQASVMGFLSKVAFLRDFMWYMEYDDLLKEYIQIDRFGVRWFINLSKTLRELDPVYNFEEFDAYVAKIKRILSMRYKLEHKVGKDVIASKLLSYVPEGFKKVKRGDTVYWKKNVSEKKKDGVLIITEIPENEISPPVQIFGAENL